MRVLRQIALAIALSSSAQAVFSAQLSTEARTVIPREVQQIVAIDYRAMQNSPAATELRDRLMPPELKLLDQALLKSGLNDEQVVEQLDFAIVRSDGSSGELYVVGVAQGQFPVQDILAKFRQEKLKATEVRTNRIYPMEHTGMMLCFVNSSTMVFGTQEAVIRALDARDGARQSLLNNSSMLDAMHSIDSEPMWSILDQKGTETMLHQVLGEAGALTDYETVRKRLQASWYAMNFEHGVHFDLTIATGDAFAASTVSSLLNTAIAARKLSTVEAEKQALNSTTIAADSGRLNIHFAASNQDFSGLLKSPLFQAMVE
jgi:hypothetical protein